MKMIMLFFWCAVYSTV